MTGKYFDFAALATLLPPLTDRPICGAKARSGWPCRGLPMRLPDQRRLIGGLRFDLPRYGRCRMHGGASTGPKTPEGKAAIAASNRRRAKFAGGSYPRMGSGLRG